MSLPALTLIPAGAGSGKTYTIQQTLARWVRDGLVEPDKVVAVTFTEAAAGELRERIRNQLVEDGRLEDALKLDQAYISTIHGFGLRLLTEFAFDAGFSPAPRLLNEDEEAILIRLALAETDRADVVMGDLDGHGYRYDFNSGKGGEDIFRDRVLGLIGKLRAIGRSTEDACLIPHAQEKAGQLYGETRLAENLNRALHTAVKALLEKFPSDLSGLYPDNKTFVREIRGNYQTLKRAENITAIENDAGLWQSLRGLRGSKRGAALPDGYDELAAAVMEAADALPEHPGPLASALQHIDALLGAGQDCLTRYADTKREKGLVDYTDMLALSHDLLRQSSNILDTFRERVDCLVIDEFQDTNPLQFSLLWALREAGVPTLIVGDLKQAIMGFQNADSRLLAGLQEQYAEHTRPLTGNWRTTPALMEWMNAVGAGLFGDGYTRLKPQATYPGNMAPLEVIDFAKNWRAKAGESESPKVVRPRCTAARIKALLDDDTQQVYDRHKKVSRPLRAGDIAILCPTNSRLGAYAAALRKLGIRSRMEQGGWYESPVVRIAHHALAYVADPSDDHAALFLSVTEQGREDLQSALTALLDDQGLSDPILKALQPVIDGVPERSVVALVSETIEALDLYGVISTWPDGEQARANLLRLQGEAQEFMSANCEALASGGYYGSGLKSFLAWLKARAERKNGQPDPRVIDDDAVVLMTWHKSKGREWPVVVVAACDAEVKCPLPSLDVVYTDFSDLGKVLDAARIEISPDFVAPESAGIFREPLWEEAQRSALSLLYVVLTRAREKVVLEWPRYLDNGRERTKTSYWETLVETTGIRLKKDQLVIGESTFDCLLVPTGRLSPEAYEESIEINETLPVIGRRALVSGALPDKLPPEGIIPSTLHGYEGPIPESIRTVKYGVLLEIDLPLSPAERGTLLHRCFETQLSQQYDRA
jgi:ATP-dependent exoDNAse (exonuclease V) beta subunit